MTINHRGFRYLAIAKYKDMGSKIIDLTGQTYGRLTVISFDKTVRHNKATYPRWNCRCDCGELITTYAMSVRSGNTKSCGCLRKDVIRKHVAYKSKFSHIGERESSTKEYNTWVCVKRRCNNPKAVGFEYYGGKGIKVCDRWIESYENFLADMGRAPSKKHTIDRIENDKGYEPTNCRWATRVEQAINRSTTIIVEGKSLFEICAIKNIPYTRVINRIKNGWDLQKALETPKLKHRYDVITL